MFNIHRHRRKVGELRGVKNVATLALHALMETGSRNAVSKKCGAPGNSFVAIDYAAAYFA